jgi:pimeloyl-ACP methyl ester carboxylesterase
MRETEAGLPPFASGIGMLSGFRRAAATLSALVLCVGGPGVLAQPATGSPASEEVRFASDPGVMLAGTLETPRGLGAGPFPAVVLISGTGPWTRGGWLNIRARLLGSGIAILQYDKRGLGQSTGAFIDTIPAMERDVAAAIAFLRTRRDIDHARIALVGTSQGGVAAPAVASRDPAIAAVVMLSGPVGPRGDLFLGILRSHLRGNGKDPAQIERVTTAVAAWMEARSARAEPAAVARLRAAAAAAFAEIGFPAAQAQQFVATLDDDVVLSMFEAAPDRALAAVRAPVMAIFGSQDTVLAPGVVPAAVAALAGNPDALVVTIPGMTHELQRATPLPGAEPVADSTMPIVTELVGTWLARRLGTAPSGR